MFCQYCGKEIEDGSLFCEYCGKKQVAGSEAVQDQERSNSQAKFRQEETDDWTRSQPRPRKSKGKKVISFVIIAVIVLAVVAFLFIKKPWENFRKPKVFESNLEQTLEQTQDEKPNINIGINSPVANEKTDYEVSIDDITRPMTGVEIAQESSFNVGDEELGVIHIDWKEDSMVAVTVATYEPTENDSGPPPWGSDAWEIESYFSCPYVHYDNTMELYVITDEGMFTLFQLVFNMEGTEIKDVTLVDFNDDGTVLDQTLMSYWTD
ncbi:MAG: zinc-ribbon domain-containing protein [Bacillota bacterium]|nr:zinc-ribbon domain-containing protein [Bacillota bacterium]